MCHYGARETATKVHNLLRNIYGDITMATTKTTAKSTKTATKSAKPATKTAAKPATKPATKTATKPATKTATKPSSASKSATAAKKPAKSLPIQESRSKIYHISTRDEDGMWQVKLGKGERALKLFETQAEAIAFAKEKAGNQEGSIVIHKRDGKIRKQNY